MGHEDLFSEQFVVRVSRMKWVDANGYPSKPDRILMVKKADKSIKSKRDQEMDRVLAIGATGQVGTINYRTSLRWHINGLFS